MSRLTCSQFMHALPAATRKQVSAPLRGFKPAVRSWLCQLYYDDPALHYEVWNLGERRGLLEVGVHFESRHSPTNTALLASCARHMIEIKATLGDRWEAEQWDKGWTKVYETFPYEAFSEDLVDAVARRLAHAIGVLHPLWTDASIAFDVHRKRG